MNSLKVFGYRHFYFIKWLSSWIKMWILAFQTFYIKLLRFILPDAFPCISLLWLLYKIQFCGCNTIYSHALSNGPWAISRFLPFLSSTAVNIVLHIFLLFFYRNVLAVVSPSLFHVNFRIIFIKFCEGEKNPAVTFTGNPLKRQVYNWFYGIKNSYPWMWYMATNQESHYFDIL